MKFNVNVVHLAHSGMDIRADIRRDMITTEFIFKTGLKTAEGYEAMHNDHGIREKYTLTEIPDTSVKYDPDDFSPWSWA